jgi:hypothetical protein
MMVPNSFSESSPPHLSEISEKKKCPKCLKDYSCDVNWVQSLQRHLARKNPCDRKPGTKYIKQVKVEENTWDYNALDSVTWTKKPRPRGIPLQEVAPWMFKDVFSNQENVCFVYPNKSKNEVIVKVSKDKPARMMSTDKFIKEFVNHVFLKLFNFEKEDRLETWLTENFIFPGSHWDGTFPDRMTYVNEEKKKIKSEPDFMIHMRRAIKDFSGMQTNKNTLKNILLK